MAIRQLASFEIDAPFYKGASFHIPICRTCADGLPRCLCYDKRCPSFVSSMNGATEVADCESSKVNKVGA